jgi:nitrogen fixation NifU-like protein
MRIPEMWGLFYRRKWRRWEPAWSVLPPAVDGDVMKLQIKVNDSGIIEDAKFKTYGCGSAIASSSLVTEWLKGKTLDQAATIKNTEIAEHLALPPVKIHCSILAEDAIQAAINDYRKKHS